MSRLLSISNYLLFLIERRVDFLEDVTNSIGEKLSEEQKSLVISLASLERSEDSGELDESALNDECEQLSEGAKSIIDVLATKPCSRTQLKSIFDQFKIKYYMDITESIEIEFQDEFTETVLKTIGKSSVVSSCQLQRSQGTTFP